MKPRFIFFVAAILATTTALQAQEANVVSPKKVIYETDMCLDVDDVGALAMLNAMADMGEVELLAVCYNEVHRSGVAAIDAMNTWYGRGDIPVGIYRGELADPDESAYLDHAARFPHDLDNESAPNALKVYLEVLSQQPDQSVTIISVGFLNNIYDLLKTDPELVAQKVKKLVVMAGVVNDNFNLVRHDLTAQSEYVLQTWPTPLVVSQHGGRTITGANLKGTPVENPIREAYYQWAGEQHKGRSSWDQVAVLYAVRGVQNNFEEISSGQGKLRNGFEWEMKPASRSWLKALINDEETAAIIEPLMIQAPLRQ